MLTIGRYLLLIATLSGVTLSVDDRFSNDDIKKFLDYIFRLHNAVRIKHNAQPLRRTPDMDALALFRFNQLGNLTDDNDATFGEFVNLMPYNDTTQLNVEEAMKFFSLSYDQGNFYDYEWHDNLFPTDRFTQIVWKATSKIGLTFTCFNDSYSVLAVYFPRGNIQGTYAINVQPPIDNLPASDPDIPELIYKTGKEKFLDNLLKLHNEKRRMHGVQELIRDVRLDEDAEYMPWRGKIGPTEDYGVNWLSFGNIIFPLTGNEANGVFSNWYNKKQFYNYTIGPHTMHTDSFTQIVWHNTRRIGLHVHLKVIGILDVYPNSIGEYQVVVVYDSPGNIPGQYISNAFEPQIIDQGDSSGNN